MSEFASHETPYAVVEREPPEVMARNLRVGSQLWASATAFFFFAFVFAYFYLRSLNQAHLWHPHTVKAPVALGTVTTLLVVASAAVAWASAGRLRGGDERAWRTGGLAALVLGVAAVVVQIVEWTSIGFGPTDGGYASVFVGWTSLFMLFLVGTLYWLEILVATAFRYRDAGHEPGEASGDPHRSADDIARPLSLLPANASAFAFYWAIFAVIAVATWILLFLL